MNIDLPATAIALLTFFGIYALMTISLAAAHRQDVNVFASAESAQLGFQ